MVNSFVLFVFAVVCVCGRPSIGCGSALACLCNIVIVINCVWALLLFAAGAGA